MTIVSPFAIDSDNYHDDKVALCCWKSAFYVPANFIGNTELVLAPSIIISIAFLGPLCWSYLQNHLEYVSSCIFHAQR